MTVAAECCSGPPRGSPGGLPPSLRFSVSIPPLRGVCFKLSVLNQPEQNLQNPSPWCANTQDNTGTVVEKSEEEEWEVEEVVACRVSRGKLQYQVRWKGCDPEQSWYSTHGFKGAPYGLHHMKRIYQLTRDVAAMCCPQEVQLLLLSGVALRDNCSQA